MQGLVSDKTFHLKWNNHLQNLSQLFSTIYSSSALADVTLSCRDGTLKAHKLVLSACSPYFEQIFKDNPCQHPIVILKGIPFSEINLLVEFMYKGAVDVQELDLQSLMHTASELEIRGLAYEARDSAAQLLNVNLEYPSYGHTTTSTPTTSTPSTSSPAFQGTRTDVERLKQIHMYQQSMMRAEEMRRRRRPEDPTHAAVNNILAAAAREMEESRQSQARGDRSVASIQTEHPEILQPAVIEKRDVEEIEKARKRVSILSSEEEKLRVKKKMHTVRFQDDVKGDEGPKYNSTGNGESKHDDLTSKASGIKVVQLAALQNPNDTENDCDDKMKPLNDDDEDTDSSESTSNGDPTVSDPQENRPHVCDLCDQRFQRASHLSRHRLTHTGERPFTCGGCGRSFARSDKLRMHTKICEKEDPTVDLVNESANKRENSEVMSGMVRSTHRESGHLIFTASGSVSPRRPLPGVDSDDDLPLQELIRPTSPLPLIPKILTSYSLLPVKTEPQDPIYIDEKSLITIKIEPNPSEIKVENPIRRGRGRPRKIQPNLTQFPCDSGDVMLPRTSQSGVVSDGRESGEYDPPRRGRGRPRKTPLPLTPKIKKKRGRPPKTSLDGIEGCVLTGGSMLGPNPQSHVTSASLLLKRKRGRPPKNYFMPRPDGRPNENYNATNLPFGDFSYLTEMMYNPALAYSYGVTGVDPDRTPDGEHTLTTDTSQDRTIDVSDTDSDSDEPRMEIEENVPQVACETQIMTVGDCQIVKLPPSGDEKEEIKVTNDIPKQDTPSSSSTLTITPITTVGDCTIRPVDNNT